MALEMKETKQKQTLTKMNINTSEGRDRKTKICFMFTFLKHSILAFLFFILVSSISWELGLLCLSWQMWAGLFLYLIITTKTAAWLNINEESRKSEYSILTENDGFGRGDLNGWSQMRGPCVHWSFYLSSRIEKYYNYEQCSRKFKWQRGKVGPLSQRVYVRFASLT